MTSAAEASFTTLVGESLGGAGSTAPTASTGSSGSSGAVGATGSTDADAPRLSSDESGVFDEAYQQKLVAHCLFDDAFLQRTAHLIKPDYFDNQAHGWLVQLGLDLFKLNGAASGVKTVVAAVRAADASGRLKGSLRNEVVALLRPLITEKLDGTGFLIEQVVKFVKYQAMSAAIFSSVELINRGDMEKVLEMVSKAAQLAANEGQQGYDFMARIADRSEERANEVAGILPPKGITTGNPTLDDCLFHRGWGRRELAVLMGGAKAGKTLGLVSFGWAACMKGMNVLYVTLEVSTDIVAKRLDAQIAGVPMKQLAKNLKVVEDKITELVAKKQTGRFQIQSYPTGTCTPRMIRDLLERERAAGRTYDMLVVDYADIMAPDYRTNDPIENSKQIYVGLRALADEYNLACLTATQTNRDGFKSVVAKAEHVAEDFNKIRIADIVISINATDEERDRGEARLYFAASRNQEGGFTVRIKQDRECMRFLTAVIGRE